MQHLVWSMYNSMPCHYSGSCISCSMRGKAVIKSLNLTIDIFNLMWWLRPDRGSVIADLNWIRVMIFCMRRDKHVAMTLRNERRLRLEETNGCRWSWTDAPAKCSIFSFWIGTSWWNFHLGAATCTENLNSGRSSAVRYPRMKIRFESRRQVKNDEPLAIFCGDLNGCLLSITICVCIDSLITIIT